jgi:tetratricopeptide (TPR) repeat protein
MKTDSYFFSRQFFFGRSSAAIAVTALFLFSVPGTLTAQKNKIDSLKNALFGCRYDSSKIKILNRLARVYLSVNPDSALIFVNTALETAKRLSLHREIADAYSIKGLVSFKQNNFSGALENYFASIRFLEQKTDKKEIGTTYNRIGNVYYMQGNYPEALSNYLVGLKAREEAGDTNGMGGSYISLGNVYISQGNNSDALKNYKAALKIKRKTGDKDAMAGCFNNLGNIYKTQGNYREALENYTAARKIFEELGNKQYVAGAYANIGNVYSDLDSNSAARDNFLAAIRMEHEVSEKSVIATSYIGIGLIKTKAGMYNSAREYINRGLALATEIGALKVIQFSYRFLYHLDSITGNYKSALHHYRLFISYRDSLLNEENTKKTVQSQLKYEFDKKTSADSVRNDEAKKLEELKHRQEIATQKTFTYGGVTGFMVMIIVAVVSFRAFRTKKKANEEISRQKHIVEEKQKEVLDSIYYARRIQRALITNEKYIERNLDKFRGGK